jgi:hypothetical protein
VGVGFGGGGWASLGWWVSRNSVEHLRGGPAVRFSLATAGFSDDPDLLDALATAMQLNHIRLWFFEPEGEGPPEED